MSQFWYVNFITIGAFSVIVKLAQSLKKYTFSPLYNYLRNYKGNKCMLVFMNTLRQGCIIGTLMINWP